MGIAVTMGFLGWRKVHRWLIILARDGRDRLSQGLGLYLASRWRRMLGMAQRKYLGESQHEPVSSAIASPKFGFARKIHVRV